MRANVVVIGNDVANTLFPYVNAVDQSVSINGRLYRVVGVLAERDIFLVGAEDRTTRTRLSTCLISRCASCIPMWTTIS